MQRVNFIGSWGKPLATVAGGLSLVSLASAGQTVLDFSSAIPGTIGDYSGAGTGFNARLPGTGSALGSNDQHMFLDTAGHQLYIVSTDSDINGQQRLGTGEYLGTDLATLGFTGLQDFSVSATFNDLNFSNSFDQFGLYVGTNSHNVFRGGVLTFFGTNSLYTVNNAYNDYGLQISGAATSGDNFSMVLSRIAGVYSYSVTDETTNVTTNLGVVQPGGLFGASDLYVGIYAANADNSSFRVEYVTGYSASVQSVPEPTSICTLGLGALLLARRRRKS